MLRASCWDSLNISHTNKLICSQWMVLWKQDCSEHLSQSGWAVNHSWFIVDYKKKWRNYICYHGIHTGSRVIACKQNVNCTEVMTQGWVTKEDLSSAKSEEVGIWAVTTLFLQLSFCGAATLTVQSLVIQGSPWISTSGEAPTCPSGSAFYLKLHLSFCLGRGKSYCDFTVCTGKGRNIEETYWLVKYLIWVLSSVSWQEGLNLLILLISVWPWLALPKFHWLHYYLTFTQSL